MLLTTVPNCAAGWRIAAAASSSPTARTESSLIRSTRLPIGGAISSNGHSVGSRTFDAWPRAMTGSMKPLSPPSASPPLLLTSSSSQMSLRPSIRLIHFGSGGVFAVTRPPVLNFENRALWYAGGSGVKPNRDSGVIDVLPMVRAANALGIPRRAPIEVRQLHGHIQLRREWSCLASTLRQLLGKLLIVNASFNEEVWIEPCGTQHLLTFLV